MNPLTVYTQCQTLKPHADPDLLTMDIVSQHCSIIVNLTSLYLLTAITKLVVLSAKLQQLDLYRTQNRTLSLLNLYRT